MLRSRLPRALSVATFLMMYLKSVLVGVGGAVLASILWTILAVVVPLYGPYVIARIKGTGGASSASVGSGSILIAALIGFIIGFAWEWHRLRSA